MSAPAVLVDLPEGAGPFPALVLAPGQRYHLQLPALAQVAQQCARRGIAVLRFDWSQPSPPTAAEPAAEWLDLQAVMRKARSDARLDPHRLWVGGKSLGSVLAWRLLRSDAALRGAVLLTPLGSRGDEFYPDAQQEPRPLLFLAGEQDPHCAPAALYRLAAQAPGPTRVNVVSGGHDLADVHWPQAQREAMLAANAELAGRLVADFLASHT